MSRYAALLGCHVQVHCRLGDILLPMTGTLAADSGKSIFLEDHSLPQPVKAFRWEIPYPVIVDLVKNPPALDSPEPPGFPRRSLLP